MHDSADALLTRLQGTANTPGEFAELQQAWNRRADYLGGGRELEMLRHLAERLLKLGAKAFAAEVAAVGLEYERLDSAGNVERPWEKDVFLRLTRGLAVARLGDPEGAQRILWELHNELGMHQDRPLDAAEKHVWEETLGMLARTYKDQGEAAGDDDERRRHWRTAFELYERAYRLTDGYWTGINVATLARLSGDDAKATETAARVAEQCEQERARLEEQRSRAKPVDLYWVLATLAEAALVQCRLDLAGDFYQQAYDVARNRFGDLNSTRRHARWLLERGNYDLRLLDTWLPIPQVVIFCGHMLDQPGRPNPRFPGEAADSVKLAITAWLREHNARIGFSSAACGSDILFQEAVHELDGQSYVVLPYEAPDFETDSVRILEPSLNDAWSQRYAQVLKQATQVVEVSPQRIRAGGISYDYANTVLQGLARLKAAELATEVVCLVVWDGRRGDGPGGTASVVTRWRMQRLSVSCVDLSKPPKELEVLRIKGLRDAPQEYASGNASPSPDVSIKALLFGDAVNFGKLTEEQVPLFVKHFLRPIAEILDSEFAVSNIVRNTWGDGLYLVFENVRDAGRCALRICEFVVGNLTSHAWEPLGLPAELNIRLALHAGPVFGCEDPIIRRHNYMGTHVSRAARLEPKTPPGQVYASEAFAALCAAEGVRQFRCEYVRQLDWAKHYGTFPTYAVRRVETQTILKEVNAARTWFHARKTRPIWVRRLDQTEFVQSLEGTQRAPAGSFVCRGEAGDTWPQSAERLTAKYILTNEVDEQGWRRCDPKPDAAGVMAAQVTHAFQVQSAWGRLRGKPSDYLVKHYEDRDVDDPDDVWIVDRQLFEATYERVRS